MVAPEPVTITYGSLRKDDVEAALRAAYVAAFNAGFHESSRTLGQAVHIVLLRGLAEPPGALAALEAIKRQLDALVGAPVEPPEIIVQEAP
jgi:hypothetical protein